MDRLKPLSERTLLEEPELGFIYGDACLRIGETGIALSIAKRIEPCARRRGDRRLVMDVLNLIGAALFDSGQSEEAEARWGELLAYATEHDDKEFAARSCNNLGVLANIRGQRELALAYYERALASYHRLGYLRGLAQTHHNLGISYRDLGFDTKADTHYQRAIHLARAADSEDVIALAETERAMLRAKAGDGRLAETLALRALKRFETMGDPLGRAEALRVLAAAARADQRNDTAATRLQEALEIAQSHHDPLLLAEIQRDRGLLLRDKGKPAEARKALLSAAEHFTALGAVEDAAATRATANGIDTSAA